MYLTLCPCDRKDEARKCFPVLNLLPLTFARYLSWRTLSLIYSLFQVIIDLIQLTDELSACTYPQIDTNRGIASPKGARAGVSSCRTRARLIAAFKQGST